MRSVPLTAADLRVWATPLPVDQRPAALVALGLDPARLGAVVAAREAHRNLPEEARARFRRQEPLFGFLPWTCPPHRLSGDPAGIADAGVLGELAAPDLELSANHQHPPLRLLLEENAVPTAVVPLLTEWTAVGSVVVPVATPPGALRPRPWGWPFRVGLTDPDLVVLCADAIAQAVPPDLVEVLDVREDPGPVDLLVVDGPLADVAERVAALGVLANAVLVLEAPSGRWPVVDAQLGAVRASTGARVTALTTVAPPPEELADRLARLVRAMSHGHLLDVALTAAFDRGLLLVAVPAALVDSDLPAVLDRRLESLQAEAGAIWTGAAPPGDDAAERTPAGTSPLPPEVSARMLELEALSSSTFDHEHMTASAAPPIVEEAVRAVDEHAPDRLLQAYVGQATSPRSGTFAPGPNLVEVFVGPQEQDAVAGPRLTDEQLGFDERRDVVRLTAVLVPLVPRGEPSLAELEVPRVGRSDDARFVLDVPPDTERVQARLILLHRNRVVQTALLTGGVTDAPEIEPVRLAETLTLWQDLAHLDERRAFDAALVLNRDDTGVDALIAVSDGHARVSAGDVVAALSEKLRSILIEVADLPRKGRTMAERQRVLWIKAAVAGRDLHTQLGDHLGSAGLARARRIQVVTARADHFLPLELVYDRRAPAKDAQVCARWLAGEKCGKDCFADEKDRSVVCPSVFWGLSRVIERHYAGNPSELGGNLLVLAEPRRRRRRLRCGSALMGSSKRVPKADAAAALGAFGDIAGAVTSWTEWEEQLSAKPADLLVLMPHTSATDFTMEIAGTQLERGFIETEHVTGGHDGHPIVLLFGCDTSGFEDDPAGYASTFMARQAGVVLGSLTMLAVDHAARLTESLAAVLLAPRSRARPVGELVTTFRREAARDGLLAALAVTSYGDADWTV